MHQPLAVATTNTEENSVVNVAVKPEPMMFFRPGTGEMIAVPKNEITAFRNEYRLLNKVAADYLRGNEEVQTLSAQLADKFGSRDLVSRWQLEHDLAEAASALEKAHAALKDELKPLSKLGEGKELVELIPIPSRKGLGQSSVDPAKREISGGFGLKDSWKSAERIVYVRSDKIKAGWPKYALPAKDVKLSAILKRDAQGRTVIDEAKLREFARQSAKKLKVSHDFIGFDEHKAEGIVGAWAEQWNKQLHASLKDTKEERHDHVALDAQAQLMRYLAGVGVSGTFEPFKRHVAIKAEGRAEFAVAEAKATSRLHYPGHDGWMWALDGSDGKEYDLGAVRLEAMLELAGAAGASAVAELGFKIEQKKGQLPLIKGVPAPKGTRSKKVKLGKSQHMVVAAADAELNLFMGVHADIKLQGAVQWRDPETSDKAFKDFARVAPLAGGQAGLGGSVELKVDYVDGRFKLNAGASICLGVGAKGALQLDVDAKLFGDFLKWFFYQLYHANFTRLEIFADRAFDAVRQAQFLAIQGGNRMERFFSTPLDELRSKTVSTLNALNNANSRALLASRILNQSELLKYAIPETKGMLLFQLTRYNALDIADPRNHLLFETFGRRKEAVKRIFEWAHTRRDCDNILQHMSHGGTKGDLNANLDHVMRFFEIGPADSRYDTDFLLFYSKLQARLKDEPTCGYEVAMNTTEVYADQRTVGTDHPLYASAGNQAYYA